MTITSSDLEARLAAFVEHHVVHGDRLPVEGLCEGRPDLVEPLRALVERYLGLQTTLGGGAGRVDVTDESRGGDLPHFDGFQTIERLGGGGMGEVYKLRDLTLDRIVAAKIVRRDRSWGGVVEFLREARALALFSDPRIVRIFEFRQGDPDVIVMEHVEGFELGRIAPSLEYRQRARLLAEICEAVHHAHRLGIQHRDLKPSNVIVDAALVPRILDFGLSAGDPHRGHLKGTILYLAPEQLDPSRPIDARTDVYALGVTLYELLCGHVPFSGRSDEDVARAIREGRPRLPIEIESSVPEPLQAIALKAMDADPARRYQDAREMMLDLRRWLDGRQVLARPSVYASTLAARTAAHLAQVAEWVQLRLVYPHEAERIARAYRSLDATEDDWIAETRLLSYTQIALYLGAFLLVAGSVFFFAADRWYHAVRGLAKPLAVLGAPFIGLNAAAYHLYRRDHRAVAVAFSLGAVALLPLLLMIVFHETGIFVVAPGTRGQLFLNGSVSNHQLQITAAVACAWCAVLALSTRTIALSSVFAALVLAFGVAIAADAGLRGWYDDGRWDQIAIHLSPLIAVFAALGIAAERRARPWLLRPLYRSAAILFVILAEFLAVDGRELHYLGLSLAPWQSQKLSDPLLLDTLAGMTLNGVAFYLAAAAIRRFGTGLMEGSAGLMFAISPFAVLQPIGWLVRTGEYSLRWDWLYLSLALVVALLSERRQRKSFYYAGLLNMGSALFLVADHRRWFDRPLWGTVLVGVGLLALAVGFLLDRRARARRTSAQL